MNSLRGSFYFYERSVYLLLIISTVVNTDQGDCDKTKCPGPLQYYETLNCKPIYKNPGDCCAIEYDCDHLALMSKEKCYVNGHEYEIGEKMNDTDANPCDIGCTCTMGYDDIATFNCAVVDCFHGPVKPGCYLKNSPLSCCPGEEVCPETPEDRAPCNVDGKVYLDGEYFTPPGDLDKDTSCTCQPGFDGEYIEPFCAKPHHPYCSPEIRHASDIHNHCTPVYYSTQSPQTGCSVFSRCQDANTTIIASDSKDPGVLEDGRDNSTCQHGQLKMRIGEELNQNTDYSSVCVKCVCEIPPISTCQRLPDDQCDVTKGPIFKTTTSNSGV